MNRPNVVHTYENSTVLLEYNDTFLLLNSEGKISIDFRAENANNPGQNILSNWRINFVFTDQISDKNQPNTWTSTTQEAGQEFTFTFYKMYGTGAENLEPIIILSTDKTFEFLIRVNTTAFESDKNRRKVHITVWRKNL